MSDIIPVTPTHEIVIVPEGQSTLRDECYDIRIQVFHHEQGFPLDTEIDEHDEIATHFLLRLVPSLKPIGTIRAYRVNGASCFKLSRLAVLKDYRRYKFGRDLVFALQDWVKAENTGGHAEMVVHSQIPVKGFYAKYGYEPQVEYLCNFVKNSSSFNVGTQGDEFDEDGAPHQKMVLRLSY